ncbi:hypothetical protein R4P64_33285 [Rhodococcus sp. IEGM 1366]|uniref:hypothetical protein n=1 Tax=Rhodococcus sp. IEGM 1366 TaxID=3082223 RepID=UPI002954BAC9|nr:hypothetical protein [Rhodococcus sp. IEGM 1366]MDV8071388.1 hypothetical protein [Rhodococcus sp. IEGM 1366]
MMGAAGGTATAALQVVAGLGANVIAGVADETQSASAREAGAMQVVVLDKGFQ